MSISSDGILVFGVELGLEDETPEWMGDFTDFSDYILDSTGLPRYGMPGYHIASLQEVIHKCPVELIMHCSYDYPMYILAVNHQKANAWRGTPVELGHTIESPTGEQIATFKAWCAERDIELEKEPQWLLCSMYG